jgi:hypothetical protein
MARYSKLERARDPAFRAPLEGERRTGKRAHPAPTQEQGVRSYVRGVIPAKAGIQ